jgi:hypothetical protein
VRPVLADVLDEGHMTRCVDTPGSDVVAAIAPMIGRIPRNTHATDRAESLCGVVEEMLGSRGSRRRIGRCSRGEPRRS